MTIYSDTTKNPIVVADGTTATPFSAITVTDPIPSTEDVTVKLTDLYNPAQTSLGTLSDPTTGGTFDPTTDTFTEAAFATGTPTSATQILDRLVYTPPPLTNGNSLTLNATVSIGNGVSTTTDPTTDQIDVVTPPALTGTVADQPVAAGSSLRPFGTVLLNDTNFIYDPQLSATIMVIDDGAATDADGLLTGTGLSKTGTGTYTLAATYLYNMESELRALNFATTAGASRTTNLDLTVTDTAANLSADDETTSISIVGNPAPEIAGTASNQTVAPGNAISPFTAVTVSDNSATASDSALISILGGGTLSGTNLTPTGPGSYSIAATSPAQLTSTLDALTFTPPQLGANTSNTSYIALVVSDGTQTATDTRTSIQEVAPTPPPQKFFTVTDETTGQQYAASGDAYTGPVMGISQELIQITPDNLNMTANIANVFIHGGAGNDAIDVSKVNGNNILDGSTGSNFLTGGAGSDTFYVDDRTPTSDVFSTIADFHTGDNASVFGVNATDFTLTELNNQGAVGATGLDFAFTAPGHANANLVLAGFSTADLSNGRLTITYGITADEPGVPGSQYMNIHAN